MKSKGKKRTWNTTRMNEIKRKRNIQKVQKEKQKKNPTKYFAFTSSIVFYQVVMYIHKKNNIHTPIQGIIRNGQRKRPLFQSRLLAHTYTQTDKDTYIYRHIHTHTIDGDVSFSFYDSPNNVGPVNEVTAFVYYYRPIRNP